VTTPPPVLEARGLAKVYADPARGHVLALEGLELSVRPGEVLGLLGPNGAGKTTALRILSTVLQPSAGSARVAGHDILEEPIAVRRNIGFLSGRTALYPRLTPRETLDFFGRLHGLGGPELARRREELLERLGLSAWADTRLERLSTGSQQKANLARAVLHDPALLILDEPTAGLDILAAQTLMELVEERRAAGRAGLYSTHILAEAERLCDRIAVLHEGTLRATGTLEELARTTGERYLDRIFLALVRGGGRR